ncbi:MAG: DPP IV N-terminal domain-containing protein [Bacteroidales bacterium]|nr:DPP IV N-terminal domain-containing protein [Bacteroidales bacterium]
MEKKRLFRYILSVCFFFCTASSFAQSQLPEGMVELSTKAQEIPAEAIDESTMRPWMGPDTLVARVYNRGKGRLHVKQKIPYRHRWKNLDINPRMKIVSGRAYLLKQFGWTVVDFAPVKYYNVKRDMVCSIESCDDRFFWVFLPEDDYSLFSDDRTFVVVSIRSGCKKQLYYPENTSRSILRRIEGVYSVKEIAGSKCLFCANKSALINAF